MFYLLDSENISIKNFHDHFFSVDQKRYQSSKLIVFINREVAKNEKDCLIKMEACFNEIIVESVDLEPTKNALDFYLVSCLSLLSANHSGPFTVVSNDKGFCASLISLSRYLPKKTFNFLVPEFSHLYRWRDEWHCFE